MPLNCAIIADSKLKGDEIRDLLLSPRIKIVRNSYEFDSNFSNSFPLDVAILAVVDPCMVTSTIEAISRIMPTTKIICVFTSALSSSWLFYSTMQRMVYRSIPENELSGLLQHVEEIYAEIYREVRRIVSKSSFNEIELELLRLLQQDLEVKYIATTLSLSLPTVRRHLSECAAKLSCSIKGLGVYSIRALGDLNDSY
jgi:DNA-binding NarL/FixJ family response regulator